jgi:hypothetical protein
VEIKEALATSLELVWLSQLKGAPVVQREELN